MRSRRKRPFWVAPRYPEKCRLDLSLWKEIVMETLSSHSQIRHPWNKGKLTGQKPPLKLSEVWAIRTRLQMTSNIRELAMFNLAIDSKLRACDFTRLRVQDVCHGCQVATRATVLQQKTQRPVQFEITAATRDSLEAWIKSHELRTSDFLFPSRPHSSPHLSTRQYSRIVHRWVSSIGLDDTAYGTSPCDARRFR